MFCNWQGIIWHGLNIRIEYFGRWKLIYSYTLLKYDSLNRSGIRGLNPPYIIQNTKKQKQMSDPEMEDPNSDINFTNLWLSHKPCVWGNTAKDWTTERRIELLPKRPLTIWVQPSKLPASKSNNRKRNQTTFFAEILQNPWSPNTIFIMFGISFKLTWHTK